MKRSCGLLFALALFLLAPHAYAQPGAASRGGDEPRVALVIGNGAYAAGPLRNPVNDARALSQALSALGFEVMYHENLAQNDMKRAMRAFGQRLRAGAVGLFYYAGHAMQVNGVNYLIPVGANINGEAEVEYEAVELGFVIAQMEDAKNRMNLVILDACRDNPFARSTRSSKRGLAVINSAPGEMLIAYATGPGSVADDGEGANGVYMQELLKHLKTPGLGVEDVFKRVRVGVLQTTQGRQKPWEVSSLISDFHFVTERQQAAPAGDSRPPQTATPRQAAPQTAAAAQRTFQGKVISRTGLVNALRINGLSTQELIEQVTRRGVNFEVTPEVEQELRSVGARPELIEAVRNSYRPEQ